MSPGAKSGTERVTPLVYFPQPDDSMLIVASKGGAPTNPDWYHNLKAIPKIDVEVGTETFGVEATEVDAAERAELWPRLVAERPGFGEYQQGRAAALGTIIFLVALVLTIVQLRVARKGAEK